MTSCHVRKMIHKNRFCFHDHFQTQETKGENSGICGILGSRLGGCSEAGAGALAQGQVGMSSESRLSTRFKGAKEIKMGNTDFKISMKVGHGDTWGSRRESSPA